jgi:hypothetical protein
MGAILQLIIAAISRLAPSAARSFSTSLAKRGLQLSGPASSWAGQIPKLVANNKTTAALITYELAKVGADLNVDEVSDKLGTVSAQISTVLDAARRMYANIDSVTGDGDPTTIGGIPMDQFSTSLAIHQRQKALIEDGMRAAGGLRQFRALYRAVHGVERAALDMYEQL